MCFVFHQWGKWEQYEHQYSFYPGRIAPKEVQGRIFHNIDLRQRRVCLKCKTMQDELVAESVGLSNTARTGLAGTVANDSEGNQTASR